MHFPFCGKKNQADVMICQGFILSNAKESKIKIQTALLFWFCIKQKVKEKHFIPSKKEKCGGQAKLQVQSNDK
jgi:hypothetical protein